MITRMKRSATLLKKARMENKSGARHKEKKREKRRVEATGHDITETRSKR